MIESLIGIRSDESRADTQIGMAPGLWHKSIPSSLRKAYKEKLPQKGWAAWRKYLAKRQKSVTSSSWLSGKTTPLAWALPEGVEEEDVFCFLTNFQQSDLPSEAAWRDWQNDSVGNRSIIGYAYETLAWCHALPALSNSWHDTVWWETLDHLLNTLSDATGIDSEKEPLAHQLLCGELAFTLGTLFPEITAARKLIPPARKTISSGMIDLLDGEGLPHAKYFHLLRPLLACWTRCHILGANSKKGCCNKKAQTQYEWLFRNALRTMRYEGTHTFSHRTAPQSSWPKALLNEALLKEALHYGGDEDDKIIARLALGHTTKKKDRSQKILQADLPVPTVYSPWATVAIMRRDWSCSATKLSVLYHEQPLHVELQKGCHTLWSGVWQWELTCNGRPVHAQSSWEKVCWASDEDVDYLELEIELESEFRLQRQILWGHAGQFLLLADSIYGAEPADLEYRGGLPLTKGICFRGASETSEGHLMGKKPVASVLPLALNEWRSESSGGTLDVNKQNELELRQMCHGQRLYAPLFFDLKSRRLEEPLTWRQLTVAQSLGKVEPDVAVGYRVAIGKSQWLLYRSLAKQANRTLLGHNLSSEMLVAEFDRTGEVNPLLEIE